MDSQPPRPLPARSSSRISVGAPEKTPTIAARVSPLELEASLIGRTKNESQLSLQFWLLVDDRRKLAGLRHKVLGKPYGLSKRLLAQKAFEDKVAPRLDDANVQAADALAVASHYLEMGELAPSMGSSDNSSDGNLDLRAVQLSYVRAILEIEKIREGLAKELESSLKSAFGFAASAHFGFKQQRADAPAEEAPLQRPSLARSLSRRLANFSQVSLEKQIRQAQAKRTWRNLKMVFRIKSAVDARVSARVSPSDAYNVADMAPTHAVDAAQERQAEQNAQRVQQELKQTHEEVQRAGEAIKELLDRITADRVQRSGLKPAAAAGADAVTRLKKALHATVERARDANREAELAVDDLADWLLKSRAQYDVGTGKSKTQKRATS